jgi:flagellar M-ring protein FliF
MAISSLIEKSVPDIQPDGITIIDSNMNLLSGDQGKGDVLTADQLGLEQQVNDRLKKTGPGSAPAVFGMNQVTAEVSAHLNFDDQAIESVRFEPAAAGGNTGVIKTMEKIQDTARQAGSSGQVAGADANGAAAPVYQTAGNGNTDYAKTSENISYEVTSIKENLVKAKGTIASLSVSVLLDQNATRGIDYTQDVQNLIAGAVGVPVSAITVTTLPFNGQSALADSWDRYSQVEQQAQKWQETQFYLILGAGVFLALVILFMILSLFRKPRPRKGTGRKPETGLKPQAVAPGGRKMPKLDKSDEVYEMFPSLNPAQRTVNPNFSISLNEEPEIHQTDDQAVAERYVQENPELAANIIRGWLAEDPR